MPEPRLVAAPTDGLRRVARLSDAVSFPAPGVPARDESDPLEGGRRFDDPRGELGLLYCASTSEAAYGDDIAQFRPRIVAGRRIVEMWSDFFGTGPDPTDPPEGQIPPSYFDDRVVVKVLAVDSALFVDLDDPDTHATLDEGLPHVARRHGFANFDRTIVMGSNRQITVAIMRYFYARSQSPGLGDIAGLRYQSRFAPEWERWAIWAPGAIYVSDEDPMQPVTRDDISLRAAAQRLNIEIPPA